MEKGKAVIFMGFCLVVLILFSALIAPTLGAYTETTTTKTTTVYFGPSDFSLESVEFSGTPYVFTETCSVYYYTSDTSYITVHGGTLPTCVESIIYSTQIYSGRPLTYIVSIIYKSGYYVPQSSKPASSVPWWMVGPYPFSSAVSSVPESPGVVPSSKIKSGIKPSSSKAPATSSEIESVFSSVESFASPDTDPETVILSDAPTLPAYWWTLLIAAVIVLGAIFVFKRKPKK